MAEIVAMTRWPKKIVKKITNPLALRLFIRRMRAGRFFLDV